MELPACGEAEEGGNMSQYGGGLGDMTGGEVKWNARGVEGAAWAHAMAAPSCEGNDEKHNPKSDSQYM